MAKSRRHLPAGQPVSLLISYSRKDQRLHAELLKYLEPLKREGLVARFLDPRNEPKAGWASNFDEQLQSAQLIVPLISMDFIASDDCYGQMTRALQKRQDGEAWVIPVILRPSDWKTTPIADLVALPESGKPVTTWEDRHSAWDSVVRGIRAALEKMHAGTEPSTASAGAPSGVEKSTPGSQLETGDTSDEKRPLPRTPVTPILETGPVAIDSPFYQPRRCDAIAFSALDSDVTTLLIKGSRLSGRSSLLTRLDAWRRARGGRTCRLSFAEIGAENLKTSELLFPVLAHTIVRNLAPDQEPGPAWESFLKAQGRDPKGALTDLLEEAALNRQETSLLLLFDDVDTVFDFPSCREELFSMLRVWHERRQRSRTSSWKRLGIAIAHATNPALWITDRSQSSFNVGLNVVLEDFDARGVGELNQKHGSPLRDPSGIVRLQDLIGGHPYLTRVALYTLAMQKWSLGDLEQAALDRTGPFAAHLSECRALVRSDPSLSKEIQSIERGRAGSRIESFEKLWAAGLVRGTSPGDAQFRCRLNRDFFRRNL
jgi:hypothetical protein